MTPLVADAVFWIAVACCVVAEVAIVRSVLLAPHEGATRIRRGRELVWAILPAVALGAVLALTWRAMHPREPSDHSHPTPAITPVRRVIT